MKIFLDTESQLRILVKDNNYKFTNRILRSLSRLKCSFVVCVFTLLFSALPISAQLYGWSIDEIYSSADGSVQFIQLSTQPAPGGLLGAGYHFSTMNSSGTVSHTYSTGVRQFSGGGYQYLLFASTGFTLLPDAITPDYTFSDGFLFTPAGELTVETVSGDYISNLSYSALPTDGTQALNASGNIVPAIAENFAGQTYAVPEPTTVALIELTTVSFYLIRRRKS
jgi:hypothetical protein